MKKIFITILFCFTYFLTFSQEKVNREKLNFISTSGELNEATYWFYYNPKGEWMSYINKDIGLVRLFNENNKDFKKIYVKTFIYKDSIFYALIKEDILERKTPSGYNLGKVKNVQTFVYSEQEWNKIYNINEKNTILTHRIFLNDNINYLDKIDDRKLLEEIHYYLIKDYGKFERFQSFAILKYNNKIRFVLEKCCSAFVKDSYFETTEENFNKLLNFK